MTNLEYEDDADNQTSTMLGIFNASTTTPMSTAVIDREVLLPIDMRFNDGHKLSIIVYR